MTEGTTTATPPERLEVGEDRVEFTLTSDATGGEFAALDVTIPPGGGPPMLHRHDPLEIYRVRRGELAIYVEDDAGVVLRTVAGPGAVIPIAPRREHTVRNESRELVEATVLFSPGQSMERFARAAAELTAGSTPDDVLALAGEHGIEITRSIEDAAAGETRPVPRVNGAYLTIARFSGDGDRLLDAYLEHADVMSGVGRDHGLILHAAAKTDEGFLVVNLWPSQARSESAAADQRRLGVIEKVGIRAGQVEREHHQVETVEVFS